jgi:hypothetical protein
MEGDHVHIGGDSIEIWDVVVSAWIGLEPYVVCCEVALEL